jgi:HK97 family phage major capsid protein
MLVHKSAAVVQIGGDFHFVMSDASVDRMGDVIESAGWDLTTFKSHPVALFNHGKQDPLPIGTWSDVRVENGQLRGKLNFAAPGTSPRIDEMRSLLEQGILRAASVGFEPVEYEPRIKGAGATAGASGGRRYMRQRLVECSLVTIPANANALQIAKSLNISDDTMHFVFGEQANGDEEPVRRHIGKQAATSPARRAGIMNLSVSKRIEDAQQAIVRAQDALTNHLADDNADPKFGDDLTAEIETKQAELDRLKRAEAVLAVKAVDKPLEGEILSPQRPFALPKAPTPKPQDYMWRAATAMVIAQRTQRSVDDVRRQFYGEDEATRIITDVVVNKAASAPATTTTSGWASQLVTTVNADFLESLMPASVFPGLSARGLRLNFGRNGVISIPSRSATPTIAGSFVGEGAPIPVRQGAFTATTLTPKKMAVISTFTREIAQHSIPAIEGLIRDAIREDTSVALDSILLDATAASAIRPAGLRNGVSGLTATSGGGFTALVGDIKAMAGELITATNGNLRAPVWIMNPAQALSISMTQNAGGDFPFQQEINQNNLRGYPIIVSGTVTAAQIILVDAADFVSVSGDEPEFTVSDQATLHMDDTTPLAIGTAGSPNTVAAPVRSLFQTDTVGIRMILPLNWALRRSGVVSVTSSVTW